MTKFTDIPSAIPLDSDSFVCLSIADAWLDAFPPKLRNLGRLKTSHFYHTLETTKKLEPYTLLSAAYVGVVPLPRSHLSFVGEADRTNKLELHPLAMAFMDDPVAREDAAAGEYDTRHGQLKRLYKHLDQLSNKCAGITSYGAIVDCKAEILQDLSPYAPEDRKTYAEGPLHLWDYAKAVNEHKFTDMCFDTLNGWVLFVHLEKGVVSGHAIRPAAHRFGNFVQNKLVDIDEIRLRDEVLFPILEVPKEIRDAVKLLASRCFPAAPYNYLPPPMMRAGQIARSRQIPRDELLPWTEG